MIRRILVALFLLLPSLIHAADQDWIEVRSPHFVIITDAGEKKGREVALRFEQMRSAFGALLQRSTINIPVFTEIVAFRNRAEIEKYSTGPTGAAGFFLRATDHQFIAVDLSSGDPYAPVLHDFAHMLLDANYPRTQPWFDEGFAQYFSAAQITNKEVLVGGAHDGHAQILNGSQWMNFSELAKIAVKPSSDESTSRRTLFYAESWILVHYIFDQHKLPQAANFFDLVENHQTSPAEAARRAFGVDATTLMKDVQTHYRAGHATPYRIATPDSLQPDLYPTKQVVTLQAQATLADLHAHSREHRGEAAREFETILKSDPNNELAHRGLGYIALENNDLASAAQHLKEARAINAKDPRLLYYSARLLTLRPDPDNVHRSDPAIMETYLVGATNLDADFADAWHLLADARRRQDKIDVAIDAEVNAVKLCPRNESYQEALARLYVDARQWDNAKYVVTALRSSRNEDTAKAAERMLSAIEQAKQNGGKINLPAQTVSSSAGEPAADEQVIDHGQSNAASAAPEKPDIRPVKFMRATLAGVACDGKSAVLNLALVGAPTKGAKSTRVRLVKMLVPDIQQVILVGVDTFSCDWRNQRVALNYKEGASPNMVANAAKYDGDVVSIEMH
jgi:tetratricopeptide (TPR) repeat protein